MLPLKMRRIVELIRAGDLPVWIMGVMLCLACHSCSDDVRVVTEFPVERRLTGRHIERLDTMQTAYSVAKVDGKYVFGIKGDEHCFCIYDEELNFLCKAMRRGRGHGEWLAPVATGQMLTVDGHDRACFLDRECNTLYAVDLDSPASSPITIEDFSNGLLHGTNSVYRVADNRYVGTRLQEQSELFAYDAVTHRLDVLAQAAAFQELFAPDRFALSQLLSSYNNRHKAMAILYFAFPRICIVSADGAYNTTLQIGEQMPLYTEHNAAEPHFYCVDMCSTDECVYVLYDNPDVRYGMSILVVDWMGNPVARYHVPRLTCFTVDEDGGRFIGLMEDNADGAWFEFHYID